MVEDEVGLMRKVMDNVHHICIKILFSKCKAVGEGLNKIKMYLICMMGRLLNLRQDNLTDIMSYCKL